VPGDDLRLLDWIKVLSLQILLCADGEQLAVADLADDDGKQALLPMLCTDSPPCHPAAMSEDQLTDATLPFGEVAVEPYDQHALETCFAHPLREIRHVIVVEGLTRLVGAILDQCVRQLLHLFAGLQLPIDDLLDRGCDTGLPALADPRTTFAAQR